MKYHLPLATGLAALDFLGASFAAVSGPPPPHSLLTLPPQPAGQSLGAFLDQIFSDETGSSPQNTSSDGSMRKRGLALVDVATVDVAPSPYTSSYGLRQSCWENVTDSVTTKYNISVDFSSCSTGLRLDTDFGVYTYANGTTSNNTRLRDMAADLYAMRHSRQSPNTNYANHTAAVARLALAEGNQLLNSGLICQNTSSTTQVQAIDHQELRHLLGNKHSYWTAVILGAVGGAAVGGGIAAGLDLAFNGNVTAQNVVQTGVVVGAVVIITGILNRLEQIGRLDRAEVVANNVQTNVQNAANNMRDLVPQSREAIVQNVYLGWVRRQMQRIVRRQVEEALSEHGIGSTAGSVTPGSVAGSVTPGSVTPGSALDSHGSTIFETCLSDLEAGQAGAAIAEMTDVTLNLEPIQEVFEQLGPRTEQGSCGPT